MSPYTNWATAATVIQDAVDAAQMGDEVVVTNGLYAIGGRPTGTNIWLSRVAVEKAITLISVCGPQFTVIQGLQRPGTTNGNSAVRGVYLANGASLSGFTITMGATGLSNNVYAGGWGGGVLCDSQRVTVSNCIICSNAAATGGGVCSGTFKNCAIFANSAVYAAGGAVNSILVDCVVSNNSASMDAAGAVSCFLTNSTISGNFGAGVYGLGVWDSILQGCTIDGNSGAGVLSGTLYDCMVLSNSNGGAVASTLKNCLLKGNSGARGGGAQESSLEDCVLIGNSAAEGGGAFGSDLDRCTLVANSALDDGGGASGCTLRNCTLSGNSAIFGGGVADSSLTNCTLTGNSAENGGAAGVSQLDRCYVSSNLAASSGGGADGGTLNNCVLVGNWAMAGGGVSSERDDVYLSNCTLVENWAQTGGGVFAPGLGAPPGILNNCIVYFNTATDGQDNYNVFFDNSTSVMFYYCCTTPLPISDSTKSSVSLENITNCPVFLENLRLQSNSPCINAGNNALAPTGPDLDGNQRISGGTVDIGAYEFQNPTSLISYAWLQQYGLPTDGSSDFADPDADGLNNWQEWRTGTDPTNALSALRVTSALPIGSNVAVTWQSAAGISYFLQRSRDLRGPAPVFTSVAAGILGQEGMTSYVDTNAVGTGPVFYRVGVGN